MFIKSFELAILKFTLKIFQGTVIMCEREQKVTAKILQHSFESVCVRVSLCCVCVIVLCVCVFVCVCVCGVGVFL